MPQTLERPVVLGKRSANALYGVVVAGWIAVTLPLMGHLGEGSRTAVTIVNDTVWDVGVELVVGVDSRAPVSIIDAETTQTVEEVLVPGDVWRFRWTFRGREIARTDVRDAQLREAGHRVAVPDEVAGALSSIEAPPAP